MSYESDLAITLNDSTSIDFTGSGTGNHTITAVAKISATGGNQVSIVADGLYVPQTLLAATDTNSFDFTTGAGTITGSVKISATGGNQVTVNADGLYVPPTTLTATDTSTIDLTTGAGTITAVVKVSATAGNVLTVNADGLYVPTPSVSNRDMAATSTNATLTPSAHLGYVVDTSAGNVTITLNTPGTNDPAGPFYIKKKTTDANNVVLSPQAGQIDGAASYTFNDVVGTAGGSRTVVWLRSAGTWWIV